MLKKICIKDYMYDELVFEGCGINFFVYLGALSRLDEEKTLSPISYVGASSGAFVATMLAIGFNFHELKEILKEVKLHEITETNLISRFINFFRRGGLHKSHKLKEKLIYMFGLKVSPEITFAELLRAGKLLTITITDMKNRTPIYVNAYSHPDVGVLEILLTSMLVPFAFEYSEFMDGGLYDNYPAGYSQRSIGFRFAGCRILQHMFKSNNVDCRDCIVFSKQAGNLDFRISPEKIDQMFNYGRLYDR
jgi:predicted acylesterase/phospholipase RssA